MLETEQVKEKEKEIPEESVNEFASAEEQETDEERETVEQKESATATAAEMADTELEAMFRAGVHFGYSRSRRHPKMAPYLFGVRNNIEIFDLVKVRVALQRALQFLTDLGKSQRTVLFVATKPSLNALLEAAAREINMPYVTERWLGGTLTNFKIIRSRVDRLITLKKQKESGELARYTKKERVELDREAGRLERHFGGIETLRELPAALVVVDAEENRTAVREAVRTRIPVVAIVNVDCNPSQVSYPIPGNDAAPSSVEYLLKRIVAAYKEGGAAASNLGSAASEIASAVPDATTGAERML
ncbi:MAG: 30S ribosomal protein S2 [Parcubacteria group bacterium]|nr:30S ribosomal protein S2 [Parcubacteria group bacterium]